MARAKSPAARGRMGAKAFLQKVAPEERRAIARAAAVARWQQTPKAVRQQAARKAVLARWAREKARRRAER